MDYRKEKFPVNHFVLWCKGWYTSVNHKEDLNEDLENTLKSVLALDDYSTYYMNMKDFAVILLNRFEEYNLWCLQNKLHYISMSNFFSTVKRYKDYGYNDDSSVIMTIRSYFQSLSSDVCRLEKPVFSKNLRRKYGLVKGSLFSGQKKGQTYAEMNRCTNDLRWL